MISEKIRLGLFRFLSTRRGMPAAASVLLAVPALVLLFHVERRPFESSGKCVVDSGAGYLHEIRIGFDFRPEGEEDETLLHVENLLWDIFLIRSGGALEFTLTDGSAAARRTFCGVLAKLTFNGYPQDAKTAVSLRLCDGMVGFDPGNGETVWMPQRDVDLQRPNRIDGKCRIEPVFTPPFFTWTGSALLGAAVLLLLAATAPPLCPDRRPNFRLKLVAGGCVAGTVLAAAVCAFHVLCGRNYYPFDTFLFRAGELGIGDDLLQTIRPVRYAFIPYAWPKAGNYFPFAYSLLAMFPLYNFPAAAAVLYAAFGFVTGSAALHLVRVRDRLERLLLLVLAWGTLPMLLLWISGNLEMLMLILVILSVIMQFRTPSVSALLLAIAINIKFYPGVLGVLFLKAGQYRQAALCALLSLLLLACSLAAIGWNISGVKESMRYFTMIYAGFFDDGLVFSHSLFSIYRCIGLEFFGLTPYGSLQALPVYTAVSAVLLIGIAAYVLLVPERRWRDLFLLAGAAVFLPPISFDYTLVLLYPALWYFLRERRRGSGVLFYAICWILLLIPENWRHSSVYPELQISVLIKPAVFLLMAGAMTVSGVKRQLKRKRFRKKKFFRGSDAV